MDERDRSGASRRGGLFWGAIAVVTALGVAGIGLLATQGPRGERIPVVGAGALSRLGEAPEGFRYDLDVEEREAFEGTHARVTAAIGHWPDIIVLGLDARSLAGGEDAEAAARATLLRITQQAENATAVPVVLGFVAPEGAAPELVEAVERTNAWWRADVCRAPGRLRICVEAARESEVPAAIAGVLPDALARHDELEASTQVGR